MPSSSTHDSYRIRNVIHHNDIYIFIYIYIYYIDLLLMMKVSTIICKMFRHSARSMDGRFCRALNQLQRPTPHSLQCVEDGKFTELFFLIHFQAELTKNIQTLIFLQHVQFLAGSFLGPGFHSVSMDVTSSLKP